MLRSSRWLLRNAWHYLLLSPVPVLLTFYACIVCSASVAYAGFRSDRNQGVGLPSSGGPVSAQATDFYNWSGYAATGQTFMQVASTFVVPQVQCDAPNAQTMFWVGLDGFAASSHRTVEQDGIAAVCSDDPTVPPAYQAFWEMYPTNMVQYIPRSVLAIAPGDTITAQVRYDQNQNFDMTLSNHTNHQHFSATQACGPSMTCARQSAEWVVERPTVSSAYASLAKWNTFSFGSAEAARANQSLQPISAFSYQLITMVDNSGQALATADGLNAAGGDSFADTWLAAD